MNRTALTLGAVLLIAAATSFAGDVPAADQLVQRVRKDHPRLYIDAAGFDQLKDRVAHDKTLARWAEAIRRRADQELGEPVSKYELLDGKRLLYISRRVLERTFDLAMTYRLTGQAKYRDRLWAELNAVAGFKTWHPVHFLDVAEMTHAVAVGYDWLYNDWTDAQRKTLADAIVRLGLAPGLEVYESHGWWSQTNYNWNQVCNGGMTLGALAVAQDHSEIAGKILHDAIESVPRAMKTFAPDGGWPESIGYWHYATSYNVDMIAALNSAIGEDFDLSDAPGFDQTGWFPIYMTGPVATYDFADTHATRVIHAPQMFWLATRFKQPMFAAYQLERVKPVAQDLIWCPAKAAPMPLSELPRDKWFHRIDIATMRSSWDDDATFIGFKGGRNGVNHGHLDLGSFVLDAIGERWAEDLGSDNYNMPGYFGSKRWTYYRLRAEGHNTLVINPDMGPDQNATAEAPITKFVSDPQRAYGVVDLSAAYSDDAKSVKRGLMLYNHRRDLLVQDEINCEKPGDVWWFLHTKAGVKLTDGGRTAVLTRGGKTMRVALVQPTDARFHITTAEPMPGTPNPDGQGSNREITCLAIHLPDTKQTRIVVTFTPQLPGPAPAAQLRVAPLDKW